MRVGLFKGTDLFSVARHPRRWVVGGDVEQAFAQDRWHARLRVFQGLGDRLHWIDPYMMAIYKQ